MKNRQTILAIDDTPANLRTLGEALASDYDIQFATSGAQGLALAEKSPPDLILLDVMMPEMDGYEVCRRLKASDRLGQVPVVFLTALSASEAEEDGLELGAADYLTKPINVAIARLRVRNLLEHEALRKRVEAQRDELGEKVAELERMRDILAQEGARRRAFFEQTRDGVAQLREDGSLFEWNPAFAAMLGYADAELEGLTIRDWDTDVDCQAALEAARVKANPYASQETRLRRKDGTTFEVEIGISPIAWMGKAYYFCLYRDITVRKQAEVTQRLAATVFSHAKEGILITDPNGLIIEVNRTFSEVSGFGRDEVLGRKPSLLKSGRQSEAFYADMWNNLKASGYWSGEIWNRRKNGEIFPEILTISAVRDAQGNTQQYVALFTDITEIKEREHRLQFLAQTDPLTKLANRSLLFDRLRQSMVLATRQGIRIAVCYLDVDGFKPVNDTHGHEVGDHLLKEIAGRLKLALRESDTLARIGGDEFVAVLFDSGSEENALETVKRLGNALSRPYLIEGIEIRVSASIGMTIYPQAVAVDVDQLLNQADQAMYRAKSAGKNRYELYDGRAGS